MEKCSSCGKEIANDVGSVKFKCPDCGRDTIYRCKNCRQIAARYTCKSCSFSGPN